MAFRQKKSIYVLEPHNVWYEAHTAESDSEDNMTRRTSFCASIAETGPRTPIRMSNLK